FDESDGSMFDLGIYDVNGDCSCEQYAYKKPIKENPKDKTALFEIEEYEIFQVVEKS
ncbi:6757_t:CDS:1, partial [Scutellospora calospora]